VDASHVPDEPTVHSQADSPSEVERRAYLQLERDLVERLPGVPRPVLVYHINQARSRHTDASIRDFVPIFVEREVRRRLATRFRDPA